MKVGIKGLAITPPIIGRISIGKIIEKNGKRLPSKDDGFTITTQAQRKGEWVDHPLQTKLLEEVKAKAPGDEEKAKAKLRAIPVTVMFDDPALNIRSEYTAFDKDTGRPRCVGNGDCAKRYNYAENKVETVPCPSPDGCEFGQRYRCKTYGRLNIQIEGQGDDMATFIFRTTGFNSIRTLHARLEYLHAATNGMLAGLPMTLRLRGKSTTQSHRDPIFYVDLEVRDGMSLLDAVKKTKELHQAWDEAGLNRQAFEEAARLGFGNGLFEDTEEDVESIIEEFYNEAAENSIGAESDDDRPAGQQTPSGSLSGFRQASEVPADTPAAPSASIQVAVAGAESIDEVPLTTTLPDVGMDLPFIPGAMETSIPSVAQM